MLAPLSAKEQVQFLDMLQRIAEGDDEARELTDGAALTGGVAAG
jgi:hypothetical protein